jgi:hypothetical protein
VKKILITLAALAVSATFSLAGAGQAAAKPGVCVSGPWGYAQACVEGPGWVDWNPHWKGWHPGKNVHWK